MKEKYLIWIYGFIVLFSGVVLPDSVTVSPGGNTTSAELSAVIIGLKITNRIYNDSLTDKQSPHYRMLRGEVENVFFNTYSATPLLQYEGISEMTFSNGSVIASSTALFGSNQINEHLVKNIFVLNYKRRPSAVLDLNISYTADQEPTPATLPLELADINSTTYSVTSSTTSTTTAHTMNNSLTSPHSSAETFTHSPTHTSTHTSIMPSIHTTINASITTSNTDLTSHTSSQPQSHTLTGLVNSAISQSNNSNNETHWNDTTVHPIKSSTHHYDTPNKTVNTILTEHPSHFSTTASNHSASSVSSGPGVTKKPSGPGGSDTTPTTHSSFSSTVLATAKQQGVPGWGVALLVLAAIILFLLLLLFILLLLCWCCWWRRQGFMNVSDPDPPGYYNPDIPMYSTHSTYDSQNSKPLQDSDSEKPPKTRTGMYVVNQ